MPDQAPALRVLIVEDNPDDAQLMVEEMRAAGIDLQETVVESEAPFRRALADGTDLIIVDHTLPRMSGPRAFEILKETDILLPVIVVSGTITEELAIEYMQKGAFDYILKDRMRRLGLAVRSAVERHRLELEAMGANRRLGDLMSGLQIGELTTTEKGDVVACNDPLWLGLGYPSRQSFLRAKGADWADGSSWATLLQILAADGVARNFELLLRHRSGSQIWTIGQFRAARDAQGRVLKIEGLLFDTTARKEAELELAASRHWLDLAVRTAPIGLATLNRDLVCTFAVGSAVGQLRAGGFPLVGQAMRDMARDRPDVIRVFERALEGEDLFMELPVANRFFRLHVVPIRDGPVEGVTALVLDLTDRHVAEASAEARAREQSAVRELAEWALRGRDVEDLLGLAAKLAKGVLRVDRVVILRYHPSGEMNPGPAGEIPESQVPHIVSALSLRHRREKLAIDRVERETLDRLPFLKRQNVTSLLVAPIWGNGSGWGALMATTADSRVWSEEEGQFLELMARTLWAAVERRRLQDEREDLIGRISRAAEDERSRIAADVHDDAVQVMSAALMRMQLLRQEVRDQAQRDLIGRIESSTALAVERLRSLLFELSPPALEQEGLQGALELSVDELQRDHSVEARLAGRLSSEPEPMVAMAVYRIVQEALTNVRKHSEAKHVTVTIAESASVISGRVEDDGRGFDPTMPTDVTRRHLGLSAMRQRAELAGGTWDLSSRPGGGTTVEFSIPLVAHSHSTA